MAQIKTYFPKSTKVKRAGPHAADAYLHLIQGWRSQLLHIDCELLVAALTAGHKEDVKRNQAQAQILQSFAKGAGE